MKWRLPYVVGIMKRARIPALQIDNHVFRSCYFLAQTPDHVIASFLHSLICPSATSTLIRTFYRPASRRATVYLLGLPAGHELRVRDERSGWASRCVPSDTLSLPPYPDCAVEYLLSHL